MKQKLIIPKILALAAMLCLFACDAWKDDMQLNNSNLDKNLNELIVENPDISVFAQALRLTGYDKLLREEQSLTVFAPGNEALQQLDLSDLETLKEWMKGYIAYLSYYTDASGNFTLSGEPVSQVEMLNGKSLSVYPSLALRSNLVCGNGVLHIINSTLDNRKNIWEYLQEQQGYEQIQFIQSLEEQVMDKDKSLQIGVDMNGRPVYDTIWTTRNTFLEACPLGDERQSFTVVLLEQNTFDALKTKYAKYMRQRDTNAQNKEIVRQLAADLTLKNTLINNAGRYPSLGDVLVDIDPANITESYTASNGTVYKLSAADIKIYENKIKTQIIEGEDYTDRWDGQNAWTVRYRSWASGGKDVMLKGRTRQTFEWDVYYAEKDSTAHKSSSKTFIYTGETYVQSNSTNAYIQYNPIMYSCDYEIYWLTYDDVSSHYFAIPDSTRTIPMTLLQKLLISFPGEPALRRNADGGKIENHFSPYSAMASAATAGVRQETQLLRYRLNADNNTAGNSNEKLYLLDIVSDGTDAFGNGGTLKCSAYGAATFFVANTVQATNADAGLIFLDYIRLAPKVDLND
ncbi:fasciclin domain-containing protein [Viscerimonas tarda]